MRRTIPYIVPVGALLALFSWLLVRGLPSTRAPYDQLAVTLQALIGSEAAMQRDVLRERAGLLNDPDVVPRRQSAAELAVTRLRDDSPVGSALREHANSVARDVAAQTPAVANFARDNAELQQTLVSFDRMVTNIIASGPGSPLATATAPLTVAMLQLSQDASPEASALVNARLATLADQFRTDPQGAAAMAMVEQAGKAALLAARVDASLGTLLAMPGEALFASYRAQLEHDRIGNEQMTARFRVASGAAALLLLALLVGWGVRWRANTHAILRHSRIEHLISQFSTRLIGCAADEISSLLGEAVAAFGPAFAADRCYLLRSGDLLGCDYWRASGSFDPESWPRSALTLFGDTDLVAISAVSKLPSGALRDGLLAAGVASWAGAAVRHGNATIGLIGFDRLADGAPWLPADLGLLGLASEVVASALHRLRVLQERVDLELRLSRARRLEAVGTFASGIAHNFNNVIGAIVGHAEMARDSLPKGEVPAWHVNEIRRAGERAHELVAHILDYSSRGSQARVPLQLDALLRETLSLLRASVPAKPILNVPDDCSSCVVAGEAAQLQQVFVNLIRNAAQASTAEARIVLDLAAIELPTSVTLSHGKVGSGAYVRVAVSDNGVGMDAATLSQLFQPFHTTRPGGTGLGLATAWEIVRDHDGVLNVRSAPGCGTTFQIWLPALPPSSAPQKPVRAGAGQTVLVLNPDENSRFRDEDVLAALGYEPVGYDAMATALAACRADPGRFAAVIMDQAAATAPLVARDLPQLASGGRPIILLGSTRADADTAELMEHGVVEVVPRPLRSGVLAAALTRWI